MDPKLKRTRVVVSYTADDGYRYELTAKGGTGSVMPSTGGEAPPHAAFLEAIGELARLCELFGFGEEASKEFTDAQSRVRQWREQRAA